MKKSLYLTGVSIVLVLTLSSYASLVSEAYDVHYGRNLMVEPNGLNVTASIGGEFAAHVVSDNTKKAGGGEATYFEPYIILEGDVTYSLAENTFLGFEFKTILPESAMLKIEDERKNRVNNRGFFWGPQTPTLLGYIRGVGESNVWQLDAGRDKFLGFEPLFPVKYQGMTPLVLRNSEYFDSGASFSNEHFIGGRKAYGFRLCVLNSESWRGIENKWVANSYPRFGAQVEVHPLSFFKESGLGNFSLLASWTNSHSGSSTGAKEEESHILYGAGFERKFFGWMEFETRFIYAEISRGSLDIAKESPEETRGWVFESRIGGFELAKGKLDLHFFIADARHDSGQRWWLWKAGSYEKQKFIGTEYKNPFGLSENLSLVAGYFKKDFDSMRSWKALGDDGFILGGFLRF